MASDVSVNGLTRLQVVLAGLIAILAIILVTSPLFLNVDSAMYLEVGRYLLEGRTPYVDYVELNPPLIHYINVIPVAIAQLLSINPIIVYKGLVVLVLAYAAGVSRILLRPAEMSRALPLMMLFPIVLVFETIADYAAFGQRDHLIGLVLVPWLLLRTGRYHLPDDDAQSRSIALLTGFFAAIAMALRPYFVVPLALVELYFLARYRTVRHIFRAETVIVIVTGVLYLAHFALLPQASRDFFFGQLIPLVQNAYISYSLYSGDDFWLLMNARYFHVIFAYIGSLLLYFALPSAYRPPMMLPLFIFAAGAYGVYLYQRLGFNYQAIPATIAVFLIFVITLAGYAAAVRDGATFRMPERLLRILVLVFAISTGLMVLVLSIILPALNRLPSDSAIVTTIEAQTEVDDAVFFVDTAMAPAFPLITRMNRDLDMTFVQAFPIAFTIYGESDPTVFYGNATLPEDLAFYLDALERDVAQYQPVLVLINSGACYGCPDEFIIYDWLESRGFVDQHLQDYSVLEDDTIEGFVIFQRDR